MHQPVRRARRLVGLGTLIVLLLWPAIAIGEVSVTPSRLRLPFLTVDGRVLLRNGTGPEKVTNGTFTGAATGWTLTSGWTYNANAVDKDGDGTTTLSQDVSAVANDVYLVVYTVSNWTVGSVTVAVGGVSGTARSANGTYREYIGATGTGNLIFTPTNTARLTVDTVSVKKVAVAAADGVSLWVEDEGGTAGRGALFIRGENGNLLSLGGQGVLLPDGTEAAPSLVGAGTNNNTGLVWPFADYLGISINGTNRYAFEVNSIQLLDAQTITWVSAIGGSGNTNISRDAAGTVYLYGSSTAIGATQRLGNTNVGYEDLARNSEAHTLAAAGTSTTATAVWPATSASLGAAFRITTEITGCTSVQVGVTGDTTRYGTFSTLTAGQTIAIGRIDNYATATGVLFTCVGGGASFTAGVVRVNLRYITASAPTS